jgi:hypothetical protein
LFSSFSLEEKMSVKSRVYALQFFFALLVLSLLGSLVAFSQAEMLQALLSSLFPISALSLLVGLVSQAWIQKRFGVRSWVNLLVIPIMFGVLIIGKYLLVNVDGVNIGINGWVELFTYLLMILPFIVGALLGMRD